MGYVHVCTRFSQNLMSHDCFLTWLNSATHQWIPSGEGLELRARQAEQVRQSQQTRGAVALGTLICPECKI